MQANELLQLISSKKAPIVLDVRSSMEFNSGHIPGAIHAPNMKILLNMAKLPEDKTCRLVVTCEHGPRAQMAQSLLSMYGYKNTTLLDGHMSGWRRAGLNTEKQETI
jgi:hydroxyacylglutathione hydrolase